MAHPYPELSKKMKHNGSELVPKFLVQAMFGLMIAALAMVSFAVLTDHPHSGVPPQSPVVKALPFTLQGDRTRTVSVIDAEGRTLATSADEKHGFIGVVSLSVLRERKVQHVDPIAPLSLQRLENGHTIIKDETTGWSIDLISFGSDNVAAFATLLD